MTTGILYPVQTSDGPQLVLPIAATCPKCAGVMRPMVDAWSGSLIDVCAANGAGCGFKRAVARIPAHCLPNYRSPGATPEFKGARCPYCPRSLARCYGAMCERRAQLRAERIAKTGSPRGRLGRTERCPACLRTKTSCLRRPCPATIARLAKATMRAVGRKSVRSEHRSRNAAQRATANRGRRTAMPRRETWLRTFWQKRAVELGLASDTA